VEAGVESAVVVDLCVEIERDAEAVEELLEFSWNESGSGEDPVAAHVAGARVSAAGWAGGMDGEGGAAVVFDVPGGEVENVHGVFQSARSPNPWPSTFRVRDNKKERGVCLSM
jgi:hypothetical protein